VRDDIPASFHAIRNDYNGHILWSRELIEDMHSRGAVGICACRTEGYQSLSIVYNF
jgi:hypothetical protein